MPYCIYIYIQGQYPRKQDFNTADDRSNTGAHSSIHLFFVRVMDLDLLSQPITPAPHVAGTTNLVT